MRSTSGRPARPIWTRWPPPSLSGGCLAVSGSRGAALQPAVADGNATTFHVHGGGLVISRMVNEFSIAKKVSTAIQEAFTTHPAS